MQIFECLQIIPDPGKKREIHHLFVAIERMVSFFKLIWHPFKNTLRI
ncbi:MAG: hypothetical protein NTZ52_05840 [Chlamydiae bacterium]|nr:hypothetical protein [Chlamydiota bacterium]